MSTVLEVVLPLRTNENTGGEKMRKGFRPVSLRPRAADDGSEAGR
jgi:hypothetical protein